MVELLSSEWEAEVIRDYKCPFMEGDNFSTYFFGRHSKLEDRLRDCVVPMKSDANILYVGVGKDGDKGVVRCASGPFEIAAILEGLEKKDYRMTIMDIDRESLEIVRTREEVFYQSFNRGDSIRDIIWEQYLRDIGLDECIDTMGDKIIRRAKIPKLFEQKRKEGFINFIPGDIVTTNIKPHGPFDLVHCVNVLDHLYDETSHNGKIADNALILAVYNMARNMSKNGILIVNDSHHDDWFWDTRVKYRMNRDNGYLKRRMGLDILEEVKDTSKHSYLFFSKI